MVKLENQITATDKTKHAFASFRRSMSNSQKAVKGLAGALTTFVGVASIIKLGQLTNEAVRFGSQIAITSSKIGVSAKNLQALRLAGKQFAGIEANVLDMGLQRFARRLGEADSNTGELKATLDEMGISTRNADGSVKSVTDALLEYADGIAGAESSSEQLRLAFKGFDSEGAVLVELFKNGSDNLRELMDTMQSSGAVMSNVMSARAKELNKDFALQTAIINTQLKEAFIGLAPVMQNVLGLTAKISKKVNDFFTLPKTKFIKELEDQNLSLEQAQEKLLNLEGQLSGNKLYDNMIKEGGFALVTMIEGLKEYIGVLEGLAETEKKVQAQQNSFFGGFAKGLKDIKKNLPTLAEEGLKFATTFETGLKGAFDSVIDGTKSVGDALKDFGKMLLQQAIKMMIFRTILAPISGALGGIFKIPGMETNAMGGSVTKGKPTIVGEKGAEVFLPHSSGSIIPNHKLGGGGVVVNQTINLSGDVSAQIRSQVLGMLPSIAEASRGAVLEAQRRGQPA
tara:strand:- start:2611 stop:4146 length:1536 start_codon:yes stop_codon:yes gene_type:complete